MRGAPRRVNGDASGMHTPRKDEIPTPIFEGIRPNRPCEPQTVKTLNTIEDKSYRYSMEEERRTRKQTTSVTTAGDNTIASNTVVRSTENVPNDSTVSNITVSENFLKEFSNTLLPKSAKIWEMTWWKLCVS